MYVSSFYDHLRLILTCFSLRCAFQGHVYRTDIVTWLSSILLFCLCIVVRYIFEFNCLELPRIKGDKETLRFNSIVFEWWWKTFGDVSKNTHWYTYTHTHTHTQSSLKCCYYSKTSKPKLFNLLRMLYIFLDWKLYVLYRAISVRSVKLHFVYFLTASSLSH